MAEEMLSFYRNSHQGEMDYINFHDSPVSNCDTGDCNSEMEYDHSTLDINRLRRVMSCFYLEDDDSSIENVTKFNRTDEHSRRPDGGHVGDEPCNFDCETIKITNNFNTCNSINKHKIPAACSILEEAIEQTFNPIRTVGGIPSESIEEKQTKILYEIFEEYQLKSGLYEMPNYNGHGVMDIVHVYASEIYHTPGVVQLQSPEAGQDSTTFQAPNNGAPIIDGRKKSKRRRTDHKRGKYKFFNGEQVKLLDEVFAKNRYPTSQDYEDLVNTLNCDKIRIKRYFQNKRQKKDNKKKIIKKIQTSIVVSSD